MPKLTPAVRLAAGSILLFSLAHIIFWGMLAFSARANLSITPPYNYFFPILCFFSAGGLFGVAVAVGIFCARNWARIAVLVLAALVAFFCLFAVLALVVMSFGSLSMGLGIEIPQKNDLVRVGFVYFLIFALALWWIILFSRKSVAAQFSGPQPSGTLSAGRRASCPPPIALLAWLMILSSALSAISWPLILGKIPAMLFTHIFALTPSKWIWIANIALFLICGIGLLKLQRWSYYGTIVLHGFWLVSLFVSQLSSNYSRYLGACLTALQADEFTVYFIHFKSSAWVAAIATAIPTALLIAGLFYYRRGFLQAVDSSRQAP